MKEINTQKEPLSIGPFSQAIRDDGRIHVSGQGSVDPESGDIVGNTIEDQTAQTLENAATVLEAADRSVDDIVKATVFVRDMDDYDAINDVYADHMNAPYPTRSAVEVTELPIDIGVEINAIMTDQ